MNADEWADALAHTRLCVSLPFSYSERSPSPLVFSPPVSHIQSVGKSSESLSEGDDGFANVGASRVPILNLVAPPTAAEQEISNGALSIEVTALRQCRRDSTGQHSTTKVSSR